MVLASTWSAPASAGAGNATESLAPAAEISYAIDFRHQVGFDSDLSTVARAETDPVGFPDRTWGLPLTTPEGAELNRRVQVQTSLDEALA